MTEYAPLVVTPVATLTAEQTEMALCAQADPEAWFPEKGGSTRTAKAVCAHCPIREACLEVALANGYREGVWGGASWLERKRILRARAVVAA
ncbi:WhiB family transcriptional regulator [Isoptericola sp. NPDC055881]